MPHTTPPHRSGALSAGVGSAISLLEGDVMDNYVVSIASLRIHSQEDPFVATLLITQGCGSNAPTVFSKDVSMRAWEWMTVEVAGVPFNRAAWERGDDLCVKLTGTYTVLDFFSMFVGLTFVPNKGVPELLTPALSPDAVAQHIAAGSYDGVNTTWGIRGALSSSAQTYAGVITCTEYGKLGFSLKAGKPGFVTIHDHTGAETAFSFSEDYHGNLVWMDVPCVKGKQIFVVSEQASHFSWGFFDITPTAVPSTAVPTNAPTQPPVTAVPATSAPVTAVPKSLAPETLAPPTQPPVTAVPATSAPVTAVPKTLAPETLAPPTQPPVTALPATSAPVTAVPKTLAPETLAPPTQPPVTAVPPTSAPVTAVPKTLAPETLAPPTQPPVTAAPPSSTPVIGTPTAVPSSVARPVHEMHRTQARVEVGYVSLLKIGAMSRCKARIYVF